MALFNRKVDEDGKKKVLKTNKSFSKILIIKNIANLTILIQILGSSSKKEFFCSKIINWNGSGTSINYTIVLNRKKKTDLQQNFTK